MMPKPHAETDPGVALVAVAEGHLGQLSGRSVHHHHEQVDAEECEVRHHAQEVQALARLPAEENLGVPWRGSPPRATSPAR